MLTIFLAWSSGLEVGMFLGPLWRRFVSREDTKDILLYGYIQPKRIPILDDQIAKRTGELNFIQKQSHEKVLKLIRSIISTRAFELYLAKVIKDNWIVKDLNTNFKII